MRIVISLILAVALAIADVLRPAIEQLANNLM